MAEYQFLDLSGYAFTGKHAVIDLVREIDGFHVPHFTFEFGLLRVQGGVLDLEHALCEDWSPIRSDAAIRRFQRLVRRVGIRARPLNPFTWAEGMGWNYEDYYGGRFLELSKQYVDRLVAAKWRAPWPYPLTDLAGCELLVRRVAQKLRWPGAMNFEYHLSRPDDFVEATRAYLEGVLSTNVAAGTRTIVMHNAFEPYQPARAIKFFRRAKAIVVDRDARDTYVQGLWYAPVATGVSEYIARHRMQRAATDVTAFPNVLRIRFEDLIFEYDETVAKIFDLVGESRENHRRRLEYFNPELSRKNVGIFRAYGKQVEIRRIEAELPRYCDPRV